jgi:uncharacterized protein YjbI with pentapeptide repeats
MKRAAPPSTCTGEALAPLELAELQQIRAELAARLESLQRTAGRKELIRTILRRRAMGLAVDSLGPVRLDERLERLFESLRTTTDPWPIEDAMRVIDGIVARLVSRRLWMGLVALLTIIPAIVSLLLLAHQNRDLHETMKVEDESQYRSNITALRNTLHGESSLSLVRRLGETGDEFVPAFHRRLRAEVFGTLVAMEKRRWSEADRTAMPPRRYIDMRNSHFARLVIGRRIGLDFDLPRNDFARLAFDGSDLRGASLLSAGLEACRFDGIDGRETIFDTGMLDGSRFVGADLRGARFYSDGKTGESCSMVGTDFTNANLRGASLFDCFLFNTVFNGANLEGVRLDGVRFKNCDLTAAQLGESADWTGAILNEVTLSAAQSAALQLAGGHERIAQPDGNVRILLNPEEYFRWLNSPETAAP